MKGYFTLPSFPEQEPYYQMQFSVIPGSHGRRNVLVCVNEFIISFFLLCSVIVYHGYANANIDPEWVGTWLNIFPITIHSNISCIRWLLSQNMFFFCKSFKFFFSSRKKKITNMFEFIARHLIDNLIIIYLQK